MAATQVSFTLEEKTRQKIESAVASGRFSTPEEFLSELVDSYKTQDELIDEFVRTEAEAICDRMDADPSRRRTIEQVRERLGLDRKQNEAA